MRKSVAVLAFILSFTMGVTVASFSAARADTLVVLLGTGNPNPTPDRMGPAVAIVVDGTAYIVDAGTGLVRRAKQVFIDTGIEALDTANLGHVFLTHLHSDHTLGMADLLLTPWVDGREAPLKIIGPPGTQVLVGNIQEAYAEDIRIRIQGSQPQNVTGWQVDVNTVGPGFVFGDANVSVEAIRACHGEITDSFAFKFTTADKVILVSGDTTLCPAIEAAAVGVDILVHEVYSDAGFLALPEEWALYHAAHHTSATDLAGLVERTQPGQLVLYHQISWGGVPEEQSLAEIEALTDVPVFYGRDMDIYR